MMKAWLCVGMLFAVGCHKKAVDVPPPSEAPPSPLDPQKRLEESKQMAPIMQTLQRETANRPQGTPTAEQVVAAIDAAGIKLKPPMQVVGATMKAHYCETVLSPEGLGLSICEFDDEKGPAIGRDISKKNFTEFKRDYLINKKTLLTINYTNPAPAVQTQRATVAALFPKLTAPAAPAAAPVTAPK